MLVVDISNNALSDTPKALMLRSQLLLDHSITDNITHFLYSAFINHGIIAIC